MENIKKDRRTAKKAMQSSKAYISKPSDSAVAQKHFAKSGCVTTATGQRVYLSKRK